MVVARMSTEPDHFKPRLASAVQMTKPISGFPLEALLVPTPPCGNTGGLDYVPGVLPLVTYFPTAREKLSVGSLVINSLAFRLS
jgi:hypothetical protein